MESDQVPKDQLGHLRHGGMGEDVLQVQVDLERLADPGQDLHGEKRMPTQVEEVVVDLDPTPAERRGPPPRERRLDLRARLRALGLGRRRAGAGDG